MKRGAVVAMCGGVILGVAYLGLPSVVDAVIKWSEWRDEKARQPRFSRYSAPSPSPLQPGLGSFEDLDEVRLLYLRSFHDGIEVSVRRDRYKPHQLAMLSAIVTRTTREKSEVVHSIEKSVPHSVFDELKSYILRQDVMQRSLAEADGGMDGSTWYLEGRKGDFIVRHRRWSPWESDPTFVAIGKRFLEIADIRIPEDELY